MPLCRQQKLCQDQKYFQKSLMINNLGYLFSVKNKKTLAFSGARGLIMNYLDFYHKQFLSPCFDSIQLNSPISSQDPKEVSL